jgi:hypothetical protein
MHGSLRFLHHLLDDQGDLGVGDLVKVSLQALELAFDIFPQGVRDFDVVATDIQLHKQLLLRVAPAGPDSIQV